MPKVVFIPLDDRPVNWKYPLMLSKIGGLEVVTPPRDYLGWFTQSPGKGNKIARWLKNIVNPALMHKCGVKEGIDALIVSIDMLSFGGLIASRTPKVTFNGAVERIGVLKEIRKSFPHLPIYAFNILMRLSISATSQEDLRDYKNVFRYSELVDKVELLGKEKDRQELRLLEGKIPPQVLEDYLCVRRRNHNLNLKVVEWVGEGVIDYLIIAQEDAAQFGLHQREQEELLLKIKELSLQEKVSIHPGADEVGMVLLARYLNQSSGFAPQVFIHPTSQEGLEVTPLYEDRPLLLSIKAQVKAIGGKMVDTVQSADFILMVNTPLKKQEDLIEEKEIEKRDRGLINFVSAVKGYLKEERIVAIADLFLVNGADRELVSLLKERIELPKLSAYAAWNTAGNSLGTALSQACFKAFLRKNVRARCTVPLQAQVEFLLVRFLDDWIYQTVVRPEVNHYLTKELGASIWNLKKNYKKVEALVQEKMQVSAKRLFEECFRGKDAGEGLKIGDLTKCKVRLPWPRTFEVGIEIKLKIKNT